MLQIFKIVTWRKPIFIKEVVRETVRVGHAVLWSVQPPELGPHDHELVLGPGRAGAAGLVLSADQSQGQGEHGEGPHDECWLSGPSHTFYRGQQVDQP